MVKPLLQIVFQKNWMSKNWAFSAIYWAFSASPIYWEWAFSAIPIYWDWAFPMDGFWMFPNTVDFWLNGLGPHGARDHMVLLVTS